MATAFPSPNEGFRLNGGETAPEVRDTTSPSSSQLSLSQTQRSLLTPAVMASGAQPGIPTGNSLMVDAPTTLAAKVAAVEAPVRELVTVTVIEGVPAVEYVLPAVDTVNLPVEPVTDPTVVVPSPQLIFAC